VSEINSNAPTVFVIDSDERHRQETVSLLEGVGFRTESYGSGHELLDDLAVRSGKACIISEMDLPDMTGLDLANQLKERGLKVPVIILTRDSDVPTAVAAMRGSVADYLVKPFVERDLVNRLRAVIARHSAPGSH